MNLFYVEREPVAAAQALCDKHVVKMILETAQMLSTAHRLSETPQAPFVYKMTHKNHPSTKWLRSSQNAYKWGLEHLEALFCRVFAQVRQDSQNRKGEVAVSKGGP
jgi:hypothetical protein